MKHLPWTGHRCLPDGNGVLRLDAELGTYVASRYTPDSHGALHETDHRYGDYQTCWQQIADWYGEVA